MANDLKMVLKKAKKPNSLIGLNQSDISQLFQTYQSSITKALPKWLSPERFMQILTTVVNRSPAIKECTPASLIGASMMSALLGFKPVSALGEAYFVPFSNRKTGHREVQFIIGYKGFIKLAFRNKLIKDIYAETVHAGDYFKYTLGTDKRIQHTPDISADVLRDASNLEYVYAVANYNSGGSNFIVLNRAEIDSYRRRSPNQNSDSPTFIWASDYVVMAKKTAIRRLMSFIPLDDELSATGVSADDTVVEIDGFKAGEYIALPPKLEADIVEEESTPVLTKRKRTKKTSVSKPAPAKSIDEENEEDFQRRLKLEQENEQKKELKRLAEEDDAHHHANDSFEAMLRNDPSF